MYDPSEFFCCDELENELDGIDLIALELEFKNDDFDAVDLDDISF